LTTIIPMPVTPAGAITLPISSSTSMITGDGTTGDIMVFGEILFGAMADGTMADFITRGDGTDGTTGDGVVLAGTTGAGVVLVGITGDGVVPMPGIMDGDGTTGDGITGDGVVTLIEPMALTIHDGAIITGIHWPPIRCGADPT
jgi:hypothetical protein